MNKKQAKEIMIPISDFVKVRKKDNLYMGFQTLTFSCKSNRKYIHQDAIVLDSVRTFAGLVTMDDIFMALEPNYKMLKAHQNNKMIPPSFLKKTARDLNLWVESSQNICERTKRLTVSDVMHIPEDIEYIKETDTLAKAIHLYAIGGHHLLLVKNNDKEVNGTLKLSDIFEILRHEIVGVPTENSMRIN